MEKDLQLNIGRFYKQYCEFLTSSEDTKHLEIRFHLVIDHRIAFKLSSSKIENGKKQTPLYNKRRWLFYFSALDIYACSLLS